MHSRDEFRDLYHSDIEPILQKMEVPRKRALNSALIFFIAMTMLFLSGSSGFGYKLLLVLVALGASAFALVSYNDYKRDFKYKIIARIVKLIDPDYQFFDHRHIDLKTVLRSGLYYDKPDSIHGDDHVSGTIDGTTFEFSELHFSQARKTVRTDFDGLFFKIDFKRQLSSNLYIFPDWHGGLRNNTSRDFIKELGPSFKFPMEFAEHFSVFCHDEEEARQFLGPNMQKALLNLKKEVNKSIHLSFQEDHLYCAVAFNKKLFEPVIWQSALNPAPVLDCFKLFTIVNKIIDHLTLNQEQIEEDRNSYDSPVEDLSSDESSPSGDPIQESVNSPLPEESALLVDESVIDQSLNLDLLMDELTTFQEIDPKPDLKMYLLSLYKNILNKKEEVLTQELLTQLLSDSFTSETIEMEDSWLEIIRSPERDKAYRKKNNANDLGFFSKPGNYGWEDMEFTLQVLRFQIAELHKMEGKQLDNQMKEYGVASETGTPWYNFDPISNLSSGIKKLSTSVDKPTTADWSVIGTILQLGRMNLLTSQK